MSQARQNKFPNVRTFERDERLEAMLKLRDESKIRFEMSFSFNDKRKAEAYAAAKAKHERRQPSRM